MPAREFYSTFDTRAHAEAERLRARGVRFVVADAPPLGCEAASRAGIPCVVISNFTWDWIYAAYPGFAERAPDVIPIIQRAYQRAGAAWRLPMHGGFETFRTIRDVPFVARHATRTREETRERLRLPPNRQLALSSFGGYGDGGIDLDHLDSAGRWDVVITGNERQTAAPPGTQFVYEPELYASGLRYEDLVAACDAVVTKPGYGIISECIANRTAIVYTARGRFAEYEVLVREMPKYLRAHYIDQASLKSGRWCAALDAALKAPEPPERATTNGADVIADLLVSAC
jgi:L-arabinokinase